MSTTLTPATRAGDTTVARGRWPGGRRFAFTIFDDTDWATVDNVAPIYELLADLGFRTTKSVWVLRGDGDTMNLGSTCEDARYVEWLRTIERRGFEIGLHNVAPGTSARPTVARGLDRFRDLFGERPIVHCNHVGCGENIYWGDARLSGWRRAAYTALTRGRRRGAARGHLESDALFWGDLCRERVRYVRNFVFEGLDTLALCPMMPYHDPARPWVNFWFASANGADVGRFLRNFTFGNIDRLVERGGLCIGYVHFAAGFVRDGRVVPEVRQRLEYIARHAGWFAPVSETLDLLRAGAAPASRAISDAERARLERRWLVEKVRHGTS